MITRKTADKWSLKKWEWLAKHSDPELDYGNNMENLLKAIPKLIGFTSGCAYCEYKEADVDFCPLARVYHRNCDGFCVKSYKKWRDNCTKANARKVLSDVKKAIKIKEVKE